MKNTIIILYPYKIRQFDLDRYEMKYLEKKFNIEFHEFSKALYPKFISSFRKNNIKNKNIFSFNSVDSWQEYIFAIRNKTLKNKKKIIVINGLENDSYNTTRIFVFLKKIKIKRIDLLTPGMPTYHHEPKIISNYFQITSKIKQMLLRTKFMFGTTKVLLKQYILNNIVGRVADIKPDYIFVAGNKYLNGYQSKNINFIRGSTWDYSRFTRHLSSKNFKAQKNYAVFLANPGPNNPTDSFKYGTKITETAQNWYSSLDQFFSKLEKLFDIKVVIASHPKSKKEKKINYLGSRNAYSNKTIELVKNSKFVITPDSTSISYAILYKKPIYFIYTNESKKNPGLVKYIFFLSKLLGTNLFNIDELFNKDLILSSNKINKKKYIYFIKNYLTSRFDKKPNHQIICEIIQKKTFA